MQAILGISNREGAKRAIPEPKITRRKVKTTKKHKKLDLPILKSINRVWREIFGNKKEGTACPL